MYKINFYVPETHLDAVKTAMFAKGGGRIGNYDCCAWQCLGNGQFRPLAGSDAFIGNIGQVEKVAEYKVEMICEDNLVQDVVDAMKKAHPYETPAYEVYKLAGF